MKRAHPQSQRGAIVLVALCFVAVMGLALASYLAVSNRAMQLSNRSFQIGLSRQLAEAGLDEALRAFNRNDWSGWSSNPSGITGGTSAWTLDTVNKRATRTLTLDASKLGQGATATIKLRVDNYDVRQLDSAWTSGLSYRVNDLVGNNGIWYRCIKAHTSASANQPVNWNYWVPEGVPWTWDSTQSYSPEDLIVYNEVWYRCLNANTNRIPPSYPADWQPLVAIYTSAPPWPWVSPGQEALLFSGGAVVRLTNGGWDSNPPYQWRWRDANSYKFNDVVYYNGIWYRSLSDHTSSWSNYPTGWASAWTRVTSMWDWNSASAYNLNDVVYHSGTSSWYRCIKAHSTAQTPSSASSYWSNKPRLDVAWNPDRQYGANDVAYYNGVWYLSQSSHSGQNPSTATSYWASATDSSYQWSATTTYSAGAFRSYGGVWYKALATTTGNSPNNATYWTPTWSQTYGVTTGAPVIYAECNLNIPGNPPALTQLRAAVAPAPLFPNAAGATNQINFPTSATIDSYDASLGTYNQTTALFSSSSPNRGSSAVLAGGYTSGTAVTVTSARVNGYVAAPPASTSPYLPRWSYGGTAILTDVAAPTIPSPRVDLTRVSRSPYIPRFDIQPFSDGITLTMNPGGNTKIGTAGATTPSKYVLNGDLTLDQNGETLTINGPVILNVQGQINIYNNTTSNGGARIIIKPTGSAVILFSGRLYVGSFLGVLDGIENQTLDPKKCVLIGTSTGNTSSSNYYWSTLPFYGVIYMPNAYVNTWSNVPIYGAISASNIAFPQSGGQLHYDTSLRYATFSGVDQPYTVTQWRELDTTERATMP